MSNLLLGHPRGLLVCALTDMWELFGYFGMRALLIFFLTQHLKLNDSKSYEIYGAFIGLTWALPLLGGILADQVLGRRSAIVLGAMIMTAGYLVLAFGAGSSKAGADGVLDFVMFYIPLALIVMGVGLFKGNLTVLVGTLYAENDLKRDSGYTLYYFGANLGGAAAPLVCGWLGQTYGWEYGFGVAGVGMLAGMLIFLKGQKYLQTASLEKPEKKLTVLTHVVLGAAAIGGTIGVACLIAYPTYAGLTLGALGFVMGILIVSWTVFQCSALEKMQMVAIVALSALSILFFAFYEQMGSSMNLFMERFVDLTVAGIQIRSAQMISLAAVFALILSPPFSALWLWLGRRGINPSQTVKMCIGLLMLGVAFLMPAMGRVFPSTSGGISMMWPVLMFFFMECAEISAVPTMYSAISRLSPARFAGAMMGAYFLCISLGSYLSGKLAALTSVSDTKGHSVDAAATLHNYISVYTVFGSSLIGAGGAIYLLWKLAQRGVQETKTRRGEARLSTSDLSNARRLDVHHRSTSVHG